MSAVVGTQLGEDITDLSLDRLFADGKLRRNLLVGFTVRDQTKHSQLGRRQRVVGSMLSDFDGSLFTQPRTQTLLVSLTYFAMERTPAITRSRFSIGIG